MAEEELRMLYTEQIIDRYKNPRNFGELKGANAEAEDMNPICGDRIKMQLKIEEGRVFDVKYSGEGCSISQASADLLADFIKGKTIEELKTLQKDDVLKILGIEVTAVRLKCALLSLKAFKLATLNLYR
ncbi:MAG TPA: SUF system NifU family Fe-S cluster assembly protein [archaeon]|nr:SUF system NifU family Fe-S cluster assembly protein [archaeon]